jgi:predicted nucleotidyltransferase
MNARELLKQGFRRNLYKYVNGEFLSWRDALISVMIPSTPFVLHAGRICQQYQEAYSPLPDELSPQHVKIEVYQGKNSHVLRMMEFLSDLKEDLLGAYLHGSLGTYEEVPFSDFDALVILKDELFKTPDRLARAALQINSAQAIMFDFDPLQHHGWFVLTEADLESYPGDYFPVELFRHAKSLYPDQGLELRIRAEDSSQSIRQTFENLIQSITKLIDRKKPHRNMYWLKILLSQFMLLPALYVEIRDQKGIYKKFSFEAARVDFDAQDWSIMEEVSLLREKWFFEISPFWRGLMTKPTKMSRFLVRTYPPAIPKEIEKKLKEDFYRRMSHLIVLMQRKIE